LQETRCFTLFATHYFELTQLPQRHLGCANVHLSAVEHKDRIVFLHAVQEGPASQSYGLQVAQLAGVPTTVIRAARRHLALLEAQSTRSEGQFDLFSMESMVSAPESDSPASSVMIDETQPNDMLLNALAEIDPDQLSPRDALDALYRLKRLADDSNTDQ
jgi:DNA mismatch repair protein MutS